MKLEEKRLENNNRNVRKRGPRKRKALRILKIHQIHMTEIVTVKLPTPQFPLPL